mmetsp:Transcript_55333/g.86070  ORF Transcript_55333/g.86070 Transcript_55333/m.86070 type:complete len:463 (+) Transcript_55333:175-1563(+)
MQAREHKVMDRAAMIEAASWSLRQQMRMTRDRPRSKGSLHDVRDPSASALPGAGVNGASETIPPESSRRRIHSAENKHRVISAVRDVPETQSASTPTLESYVAEEETTVPSTSGLGLEDVPSLGELKRPMSRKKVPSASAAAGLGACSNPVKMTDAFEQRKMRQPIPIESWGPRPPSRGVAHRLPPKGTLLDVSLLVAPVVDEERGDSKLIASGANRSRSEGAVSSAVGRPGSKAGTESVPSSTWAAARYTPAQGLSELRRGRKGKDWGAPEELGIFGVSGTRSPTHGQQLTKSLSGVFDHHSSEFRDAMARQAASHTASWASHVDTAGTLEVSGCGLGTEKGLWLLSNCSPVGSVGPQPLPLRKCRHPEAVSVEDVEADQDFGGLRPGAFRRDTPPQVIVTRSSQPKKDRGDARRLRDKGNPGTPTVPDSRGRDERSLRSRQSSIPFPTSLDVDFLSLFAS